MTDLTIGQLAEIAGVNVETVRYYERRGLVDKPKRPQHGFRLYDHDALKKIRFIKRAQGLGFTLEEVSELLALRVDEQGRCADVRARTESKISDIESRIRSLQRMKRTLTRLAGACKRNVRTAGCPILESFVAEELQASRARR